MNQLRRFQRRAAFYPHSPALRKRALAKTRLLVILLLAAAACAPAAPAPAASAPPAAAPAVASAAPASAPAGSGTDRAGSAPSAAPAANPYLVAPDAPRTSLKVAVCAVSGGFLQIYTAVDQGLFRDYGLDVEFITLRGPAASLAALTAGEIDILYCAADATIPGLAAGAEARLVAAPLLGLPYVLIAAPEIDSIAALRGRAIGIDLPGGISDRLSRLVLERNGLRANEDVPLHSIGGSQPARYQALVAGVVQAAVVTAPLDAQAQKDGLRVLYDLSDLGVPFVYSSLHASNAFIRDQPRTIERFVAAMGAALHLTETRPDLARASLRRVLETDDPAILDSAYAAYAVKVANPALRIPLATVDAVLDDLRRDGQDVKVSSAADIATNAFVDTVQASGFFETL